MKVMGLMSGTSADGIDVALVEIEGHPPDLKLSLLAFEEFPYPQGVQGRVLEAATATRGSVETVSHLNAYLGELFARAAYLTATRAGLPMEAIDLIGSHGQTVHHLPWPAREGDILVRSTLQIGEPSIIAERTGVTTVADFRPRDMAAGGQGAPLSPYLHSVLFHDQREGRVVLNLGGVANVTVLPAGGAVTSAFGFDTGPGNALMDEQARRATGGAEPYDRDGRMAAAGRVRPEALDRLMAHPFIRQPPPKSTGRETFGPAFLDQLGAASPGVGPADLMATLAAFTAGSVACNIRDFVLPRHAIGRVIVAGGGARNGHLMAVLRERLAPIPTASPDDLGFPGKAIEATAFALLAYLTGQGVPTSLPAVTGASHPTVLGKIVPGRNYRGLWRR